MMFEFVSGLNTMGFAIAGLFFLRFYVRTRDVLFLAFAFAFWVFAVNQALPVVFQIKREEWTWIYLLRLVAFSLIIWAIVVKNRPR